MRDTGIRMRRVAIAATATLALALGGCSGDDSSSTTSNSGGSGAGAANSKAALPDGFPTDVPLPEFTDVKQIGSPATGDFKMWNFVFILPPDNKTPVESYAQQLSEAGYTVEGDPDSSMEATGSEWDVRFHSSMDGTITIAVMTG